MLAGGVLETNSSIFRGYVHCSEETEDANGEHGCCLVEGLQEEMVVLDSCLACRSPQNRDGSLLGNQL